MTADSFVLLMRQKLDQKDAQIRDSMAATSTRALAIEALELIRDERLVLKRLPFARTCVVRVLIEEVLRRGEEGEPW